jgi:deazaflavin-dependent oxidoreductase (nitroreductase family)
MSLGTRILTAVNIWAFRITHGVLGSSLAGQSVLLLHTLGRRSRKERLTPVNYYLDGNNFVLVASNWGSDNNPAWFHNLVEKGTARINVKGHIREVTARIATGPEYERLWTYVSARNPFYPRYQSMTQRRIPIAVLLPKADP